MLKQKNKSEVEMSIEKTYKTSTHKLTSLSNDKLLVNTLSDEDVLKVERANWTLRNKFFTVALHPPY